MNIQTFKHDDWTKIYEGGWSFLTSSHFGDDYTKHIRFGKMFFMTQAVILLAKNRSSGWMRQSDRDRLGKYLSGQIAKNEKQATVIANELKTQAKNFLRFIDRHENTVATEGLYTDFWQKLLAYYHPHIYVKYVVDYLPEGLLKKHLPKLQAARLAAESVLNRTEDFMVGFAKLVSKKTGCPYELILTMTKQELLDYFKINKLPSKLELKKRYNKSVFMFDPEDAKFFVGKKATEIEKMLHEAKNTSQIKGFTAFGGKAAGKVRVVLDPRKSKNFRSGEILVTGATRPEFLPMMQKAAAFVTDAGGILSHAAITAREMKKPCVIGCKIATKVFKDGDRVLVDANLGIVKKL